MRASRRWNWTRSPADTMSRDRDGSAVAVDPHHTTHQEIPATEALFPGIDRAPDEQPVLQQLAVFVVEVVDQRLMRAIGDCPPSESITLCVASVTSNTGPTGRHPCDTMTSTAMSPANATPTKPSRTHGLVHEQRGLARLAGAARHAADDGNAVALLIEGAQDTVHRGRERVGQNHREAQRVRGLIVGKQPARIERELQEIALSDGEGLDVHTPGICAATMAMAGWSSISCSGPMTPCPVQLIKTRAPMVRFQVGRERFRARC